MTKGARARSGDGGPRISARISEELNDELRANLKSGRLRKKGITNISAAVEAGLWGVLETRQ